MIQLLIIGALSASQLDCFPLALFISMRHMGNTVTYDQILQAAPRGKDYGYYADPAIVYPLSGNRIQAQGFYSTDLAWIAQELQENTPPVMCFDNGNIWHCVVVQGIDNQMLYLLDATTVKAIQQTDLIQTSPTGPWFIAFDKITQKLGW